MMKDEERLEAIAKVIYLWSFTAHHGGDGWELLKERAARGGGFAQQLTERCRGAARDVMRLDPKGAG